MLQPLNCGKYSWQHSKERHIEDSDGSVINTVVNYMTTKKTKKIIIMGVWNMQYRRYPDYFYLVSNAAAAQQFYFYGV